MFLHSGQQGQPPLGQQRQHRTAQHQCDRILDRPEQSAPPVRIGRVAQKQAPILEQRFGEQEAQAQGRPPAAALPARAPTGASGAGSGPHSPSSAPGRRRERTQKNRPRQRTSPLRAVPIARGAAHCTGAGQNHPSAAPFFQPDPQGQTAGQHQEEPGGIGIRQQVKGRLLSPEGACPRKSAPSERPRAESVLHSAVPPDRWFPPGSVTSRPA